MLRRHPVERWWLCIHVASALPGNMAAGLNWNKASILKLTWPMGFPTFCQATCLHRTICPQKGGHGIFYAVVKSLFVAIFAPWVSTKNSEQIFFWHTLRVKPSRFQMICSQVASRWYGESACWLAAPFGTSSNLAMKEREAVIHWYVLQPWVCVYIYTPVCNVEIYINKDIYIYRNLWWWWWWWRWFQYKPENHTHRLVSEGNRPHTATRKEAPRLT